MAAYREYASAKGRGDQAGAARAAAKADAAKLISNKAIKIYAEAEAAFQAAQRTSPGKLDLDSEVHIALTHVIRKKPVHARKAASLLEKILEVYHDKLEDDEDRTLYALAEAYAGKPTVARVRAGIARKAKRTAGAEGGAGSGDGGDEPGAKPLSKLSDKELRATYKELKEELKRDEVKLKSTQLAGTFDKTLLDKVNDAKKRLEEIKAEASRRGLR